MKHYLIWVEDDIEPAVFGPYDFLKERDQKARELRKERGKEHGYFIASTGPFGALSVESYPASFFADIDEEDGR